MANVDNELRRELLIMTNGVERMRIVLQEIEEAISMNQARKVADRITDELDEDDKDLKVRVISCECSRREVVYIVSYETYAFQQMHRSANRNCLLGSRASKMVLE